MGNGLPSAVTSIVVKRNSGTLFRVGFAEMNGWRGSMEDAHVIHSLDTWGFFGVFDGHGGGLCSEFIARRFYEELEANGAPVDDAAVKALCLRLDHEFLALGVPSGSTGTFAIVRPSEEPGRFSLRVGNVGDSRVLLGRADGSIVEGPGTDAGLTTDHKPDHPDEIERINRCGGHVELKMGVPRVNGDLAVSRAFGDAPHKQTGGPAQEDHPVSAEPEFTTMECDSTDFLMLVCDGISEGSFPNREVVKLAADNLRASENLDPGEACEAVCRQALASGSKDNLSCMIVLLGGGPIRGAEQEFLPGPFDAPKNHGFRKAYAEMSKHVGYSLEQAVQLRYDTVQKELSALRAAEAALTQQGDTPIPSSGAPGIDATYSAASSEETREKKALLAELDPFKEGPPAGLVGEERTKWFADWLEEQMVDAPEGRGGMPSEDIMRMLGLQQSPPSISENTRKVQVAPRDELFKAIEEHAALKWDDRHTDVCDKIGIVLKEDVDGTSQVKFEPPLGITAWLPTSVLTEVPPQMVRTPAVSELRAAVEAAPALGWSDKHERVCEQVGQVLKEDESDGTSQVQFDQPIGLTVWLPTSVLTPA